MCARSMRLVGLSCTVGLLYLYIRSLLLVYSVTFENVCQEHEEARETRGSDTSPPVPLLTLLPAHTCVCVCLCVCVCVCVCVRVCVCVCVCVCV